MKKVLLILVIAFTGIITKANDLIVEENGLLPSYSSIRAALAAANSGDRIFVKNKAGNLPWLENDTITKSVDILAYVNDSFFIVQGNYCIAPTVSATINIIGMYNINNNIQSITTPTGSRSVLRLLDCKLGDVTVGNNNYDLTLQGSYVNNVSYRHGSIIGNDINGELVAASESANTSDTSYIFGNETYKDITWNSSTMYFDIRNNFVRVNNTSGIIISNTLATGSLNKIYNNTISQTFTQAGGYAGIEIDAGTQIDVQNNVIDLNSSTGSFLSYGINSTSSNVITASYNIVDSAISITMHGVFTYNLHNSSIAVYLNADGSTQNNVGVNSGNPGIQFYDTDLTVNDAGIFGGSYTINNFFPQYTGSAKTWLTNYQFNIRTGNTLSIKANSYDR